MRTGSNGPLSRSYQLGAAQEQTDEVLVRGSTTKANLRNFGPSVVVPDISRELVLGSRGSLAQAMRVFTESSHAERNGWRSILLLSRT